MWDFFKQLEVIDHDGRPTKHFGDPLWVYLKYRRKKGDSRTEKKIMNEGRTQIEAVNKRGVFVADGHGANAWDLEPQTDKKIRRIYADAKKSIWKELEPSFVARIPNSLQLATQSRDRTDYILHPETGERFGEEEVKSLRALRTRYREKYNVQIVISDGLNALSIMDRGNLEPYLERLRSGLEQNGSQAAPEHIVLTSGRVRAGYRVGETLFGGLTSKHAILHIIGERPGTGHHTFSIYITAPEGNVWGTPGKVDHDITKVVSGVAVSALAPPTAADDTLRILGRLL
jgi:ethanolamine ammonia-lyase large subunit